MSENVSHDQEPTLEQERARAEQLYAVFANGVQAMVEKGVFDMPPTLRGFSDAIVVAEPGTLGAGSRGTHNPETGITTVELGFKDHELMHELTHHELGSFAYGNGAPAIWGFNEGITQILTRGVLNNGDIILQPPQDDKDPYIDEQACIAMLCDRSEGSVTFKDFLAVHTAPDTEKRAAFLALTNKIDTAYPRQDDQQTLLVAAIERWMDTHNLATPVWAEQGHSDMAELLASKTAAALMRDLIEARTLKEPA